MNKEGGSIESCSMVNVLYNTSDSKLLLFHSRVYWLSFFSCLMTQQLVSTSTTMITGTKFGALLLQALTPPITLLKPLPLPTLGLQLNWAGVARKSCFGSAWRVTHFLLTYICRQISRHSEQLRQQQQRQRQSHELEEVTLQRHS